ncbi:MAG: hypothetical protein HYU58_08915 [Proteobacteria bacterium]|nr:hypothetical protein [Pseudomonadota bacterium]
MSEIILFVIFVLVGLQGIRTVRFMRAHSQMKTLTLLTLSMTVVGAVQAAVAVADGTSMMLKAIGVLSGGVLVGFLALTIRPHLEQFDYLTNIANEEACADSDLGVRRYPDLIPAIMCALTVIIPNDMLWFVVGSIGLCLFVPMVVLKSKFLRGGITKENGND